MQSISSPSLALAVQPGAVEFGKSYNKKLAKQSRKLQKYGSLGGYGFANPYSPSYSPALMNKYDTYGRQSQFSQYQPYMPPAPNHPHTPSYYPGIQSQPHFTRQSPWQQHGYQQAPPHAAFTSDYIASPMGRFTCSPQNQHLVNQIMDLTSQGAGLRSHWRTENYTERKAIQSIRALATLSQQNFTPLHSQLANLGQALNQRLPHEQRVHVPHTAPSITHDLMNQINYQADRGTGVMSYLRDENFPERQILRTSNTLMEACAHHFNGIYHALDAIQGQADKLHPHLPPSDISRPDNSGYLQQAAQHKTDGTSFIGSFLMHENRTEMEGVRHLHAFGNMLALNMDCIHKRIDNLRHKLGQGHQSAFTSTPLNRPEIQQLEHLMAEGTGTRATGIAARRDPNFVERKLIEMLKPITKIMVTNLESIQRNLYGIHI